MNVLFWVLQTLLALHTAIGAVWKFSNPEQAVPSLQAIPHGMWLALSILELLFSLCLILPAFNKRLAILASIAAAGIAVEMLIFSVVDVFSANPNYGQMSYWLIVAAVCAFIVYGRWSLKPIGLSANR